MSDNFFTQSKCDRCGGDLSGGRIMSMFNYDCLCMKCKDKERKLPEYNDARNTEVEAVLDGVRNFPGIGYPKTISLSLTDM